MLKKFFLNLLSSFVGAWLAIVLMGVVVVILCVGIAARMGNDSETPSVKSHSILKIELSGMIEETESPASPNFMALMNGSYDRPMTLTSLVSAIRNGAENKNIEAIYLECGALAGSPATINALRDALSKFKESGKKIYAYADTYFPGAWYVASVADSLYLNRGGTVELKGLGSSSIYMKSLLDKIGVSFQVVKVGTFKSAVEPYIMDKMSEPARAQLDTLFGSMWTYMTGEMAASRKNLTPDGINRLINEINISYAPASESVKGGLVDRLVYGRQIDEILANNIDVDKKKLNYVGIDLMAQQNPFKTGKGKDKIAVLYAVGEIVDGVNGGINFETLVPEIVKLADDDDIKGMVLRVNSPGGSAYGSEQIGEALDYFKSKGKPLAVSMGDYAASGGYWISAGADVIYANPLTITGSIGIFGLIPNVEGLTNKLGVYPQFVFTNPSAQFPTLLTPMTAEQQDVMQKYVERGYDQFIKRVAKGRGLTEARVRQIGEGRVWDALTAQKIGLVDSIGLLEQAIDWTAKAAKLDAKKYKVAVYPEYEPSFWDIVSGNIGELKANMVNEIEPRTKFEYFIDIYMQRILNAYPLQARMPMISVTI